MKQVLTIAGSDSGGGAGIQADLKAFHANGAFGMSVVTSVTAQNTREVRRAFDLPVDVIREQIRAVFDDFEVGAVKTGMLSSTAIVEAVAAELRAVKPAHLVVDPVMISKSGFKLLQDDAVQCIKDELFPLAHLLTPNAHEAELLTGVAVQTREDAGKAARLLAEAGVRAVLVKGGHLSDEARAVDVLWDGCDETVFESERIATQNTHGTGCTFSAAIAAHLALGRDLKAAIGLAKGYITEAIRYGLAIGKGHGPTHHFYFLQRP